MIAALIIALFNGFLNYIIKYDYVKDLNVGITFFIFVFLMIFIIFGLILLFKFGFLTMLDDIINSRHYKTKRFCKFLEEIRFELMLIEEL